MEDDIPSLSDDDTGDWTDLTPTFGLSRSAPDVDPASLLGTKIAGRYEVCELVGEGGFSLVFQGRDTREQVERKVAIKIPRYPGEPAARVVRGGKLNGQLDHHYIAKLFDAGVFEQGEQQVPYMIMELVSGARLLTSYCREEELPLRRRLEMFLKVCDAVASAHAVGVVHRDLKPGNILVNDKGEPRVIDFDTARELAAGDQATAVGIRMPLPASACNYSASGIVGTPLYMAPEQMRGDKPSPASDVFSLGLMLFEIVSGGDLPGPVTSGPVASRTRGSLLAALEEMTESVRMLPQPIRQICRRCLETNPTERFGNAKDLAAAVLQANERMTPTRIAARRRMFGLAAAAAMLILAGVIGPSAWQWWLRQGYVEAVKKAAVGFKSKGKVSEASEDAFATAVHRWRAMQGSNPLPSELTLLRAFGQGRQTELAWAASNAIFDGSGEWLIAGDKLGNLVLAGAGQPEVPKSRPPGFGHPLTTLLGGAGQVLVTLDAAGNLASWTLAGEPLETPDSRRLLIGKLRPEEDWSVAISPDADLLVAASGQTLRIWETPTDPAMDAKELPLTLNPPPSAVVSSVCLATEPAGLLVGMTDGAVLVIDRQTGTEQSRVEFAAQAAVKLRRSRDGSRVAAFAVGGPLRLLNRGAKELVDVVVKATVLVHEAMFMDAGRRLLVFGKSPEGGDADSPIVQVFDTTVPQFPDFICELELPEGLRQFDMANGRICFTGMNGAVRVAAFGGQSDGGEIRQSRQVN